MDIYLGILAFTFIVALLVAFVMFARSQLPHEQQKNYER